VSIHVLPEVVSLLEAGQLARVLPEWSLPSVPVAALMPPRMRQPSKVRMAVEALRGHLNPPEPQETGARTARPGRRRTR
jgi:hypothetical protein